MINAECLRCGNITKYMHTLERCNNCDFDWLELQYDYEKIQETIKARILLNKYNMWRYSDLLPMKDPKNIVSMGEGWTSIFRVQQFGERIGCNNIFVKDERRNPTGSFKDRQASLSVSMLKECDIHELTVCSTGNVAVSYASYCAKAGIRLWVFMPESTEEQKVRETTWYGGRVIKVHGNYDQTKKEAEAFSMERGIFCDHGTSSIPGRESMKTIAYEIAEQLNWTAPDWYIQTVSGGMGPLGVWKGFFELYTMGLIEKMPSIACVQSAGCAPMVTAYQNNVEVATPVIPKTDITTISTGDPGFAYTLLRRRLLQTGSIMIKVADKLAFREGKRLAKTEGLFVHPAAAITFAGLIQMVQEEKLDRNSVIVINCSGDGLRWPTILRKTP